MFVKVFVATFAVLAALATAWIAALLVVSSLIWLLTALGVEQPIPRG